MQLKKLDSFERTIEVLGKSITTTVFVYYTHDECFELDWDFETPEEKTEIERKLSSGELEAVGLIVRAIGMGENGEASLLGCLVKNEKECLDLVVEYSLVEQALVELRRNIIEKHTLFLNVFGGAK